MHERDFRPDIADVNGIPQTIDVYTVGFATDPDANDLLRRRRRSAAASSSRAPRRRGAHRRARDDDPLDHREVAGLHRRDGPRDAYAVRREVLQLPLRAGPGQRLLGRAASSRGTSPRTARSSTRTAPAPSRATRSPCNERPLRRGRRPLLGRRRGRAGAGLARTIYTSQVVAGTPQRMTFNAANVTETHLDVAIGSGHVSVPAAGGRPGHRRDARGHGRVERAGLQVRDGRRRGRVPAAHGPGDDPAPARRHLPLEPGRRGTPARASTTSRATWTSRARRATRRSASAIR